MQPGKMYLPSIGLSFMHLPGSSQKAQVEASDVQPCRSGTSGSTKVFEKRGSWFIADPFLIRGCCTNYIV
jgi:hypothetical protein